MIKLLQIDTDTFINPDRVVFVRYGDIHVGQFIKRCWQVYFFAGEDQSYYSEIVSKEFQKSFEKYFGIDHIMRRYEDGK